MVDGHGNAKSAPQAFRPLNTQPSTKQWRNAVDSHHLPEGTHSLAPRPDSLGRLTFHGNRPRPPPRSRNRKQKFEDENEDEEDRRNGPRGRTRTCNFSVLSGAPLHWATRGRDWRIRQDSHLQTLRSKRRMIIISPRMRNGADGETCTLVGQCPAVYKTAAVAAEPHRRIRLRVDS